MLPCCFSIRARTSFAHRSRSAQQRVLEIVRGFSSPTPPGTPIANLLTLSGSLDEESAREMEEAIKAGCEKVDLDAW